ncbi:hypothetical protein BDA99DRAFT_495721 [Phascolomyces articulosus]|uniref:Replication factor A C-terminal domain-containing protein n=1 Tax=Phascolomyces articulosus TaxID=60185 RepID=A0AAD5PIJ1_9FUNG|nr:hypothetical protein BDA99DRAFT_495721 [Phascolomyces articulosus]
MAPTALHATILQATTRNMIFRKCATCGSKVLGIAQNHDIGAAGVLYYCQECDKDAEAYKANYELNMTVSVSNGERLQHVVAYDNVVGVLLGCTAEKLGELLLDKPTLLDEIEEKLIGMKCHFVARQDKKKGKGKKNSSEKITLEAIIPADPLYQPIFVEEET